MMVVREAVAALLRDPAGRDALASKMYSITRPYGRTLATAAALALSCGLAAPAHAQEATSSEALSLDEVTVTGSRIRRSTDFDTANPTTVVDSEYLKNLGV